MGRHFHWLATVLAAVGISLAATAVLILLRPDRSITLLIYLPGIAVVEALFGLWGGVAAVLLSVGGSAATRMWFLSNPLETPAGFYASWEEEIILLLVGIFVVILMELHRRGGERAFSDARKLAALLENIADSVVIFTPDLRVAAVNPAARRLFRHPNAAVGERVEKLQQRFQFTNTAGVVPALSLEDAMRTGTAVHEEGVIVDRHDGRRVHVLMSLAPWRDSRGEVAGGLVLLTDLTALRELQQRALDTARHLALAQMISGLTHDFNHVLDIVRRANAVLDLQENAPVEERRKYREMIDRATRDGGTMVRRLRDYLAGGAGATGPIDLTTAAQEAIELTRPLWRTRPGVELVQRLEPVPMVRGNLNDLRRVLTNLIFNAIEALGPEGGRVEIYTGRCENSVTGDQQVCAWVEDNGRGIPPDIQARLFEPYVTSKPAGMGIGLFGAQKIMLAHGGKLSFTSAPGQGSRFTIELPAIADQGRVGAA